MAKQAVFYERAVPVSAERHRGWSIDAPEGFKFASQASAAPLALIEFQAAAPEYVIVFVGANGNASPTVILGIKPGDNLYLDEAGQWKGQYVPAFVRRYPFVFANTDDKKRLMLCIDEDYVGWNQDGRGKRLFDPNGDQTEFLKDMLRFLEDYQRQGQRTLLFSKELEELDLLDSMTARFKLPTGEAAALGGFKVVNRDKLHALSGARLSKLAKSGALELIYLHLQSMRNLSALLGRVPEDFLDNPAADMDDKPKKPKKPKKRKNSKAAKK